MRRLKVLALATLISTTLVEVSWASDRERAVTPIVEAQEAVVGLKATAVKADSSKGGVKDSGSKGSKSPGRSGSTVKRVAVVTTRRVRTRTVTSVVVRGCRPVALEQADPKVRNCNTTNTVVVTIPPVSTPPGSTPSVPNTLPDAGVLVGHARDAVELTLPELRLSPRLEDVLSGNLGGYLVGMAMYVSVEDSVWVSRSAVATLGSSWVRVVSVPVRIEGLIDGEVFVCAGRGVVVDETNWRSRPDVCNHVFETNGMKALRVHVVFENTYTAANVVGELPVGETMNSPDLVLDIPVVEAQVVLTR